MSARSSGVSGGEIGPAQRAEIIALYKEHGSIPAVRERVNLPFRTISKVVGAMPDRQAYTNRGTREELSRGQLLEALDKARRELGEPLSAFRYSSNAARLGLPAYYTITRSFGSWQAALGAAGIEGHAAVGPRAGSISVDDCVESVAQCFAEFGQRVSHSTYSHWAGDNGRPSGGTVRNKCGGWGPAAEAALVSLGWL